MSSTQWIRKCTLILTSATGAALDLSDMHIQFSVHAADVESPNNAEIRVYNLSSNTVKAIRGEYSTVVLSAGYENGNFGIIFTGTIKQYREGRMENNVDTFLDILAADGDIGYNQGTVNTTLAAGTTPSAAAAAVATSMGSTGVDFGTILATKQNVPSLRGQVLFGMARARLRNIATSLDSGWSIQNGIITVTPNKGYRAGSAVVLSRATGLIGVPEQTDGGINARSLLNSRIRIGGLVTLSSLDITTLQEASPDSAPVSYNSYQIYNNAPLGQSSAGSNGDGVYRAFSVEHEGDTRSTPWYSKLVLLAIDPTGVSNG